MLKKRTDEIEKIQKETDKKVNWAVRKKEKRTGLKFQDVHEDKTEAVKKANSQVSKLQRQNEKLQARVEQLKDKTQKLKWTRNKVTQLESKIEKLQTHVHLPEDKDRWISKLESENERLQGKLHQLEEERSCRICMDNEVTYFFIPCGHAICCDECFGEVTQCSICRAPIEKSLKVYFS